VPVRRRRLQSRAIVANSLVTRVCAGCCSFNLSNFYEQTVQSQSENIFFFFKIGTRLSLHGVWTTHRSGREIRELCASVAR
jgi:hypothetical protein